MKVLLIDHAIDAHSKRFLDALLNAGHVVLYISASNILRVQTQRFKYHRYPTFVWTYDLWPYRFWRVVRDVLAALTIRRFWWRFQPDISHVLLITPNAYHCVLAGIRPLVLTSFGSDINGLFEFETGGTDVKKRIGRTLRFADYITADTSEVLLRCKYLAGKELQSGLFYFGIDLNLFKPASAEEKEALRKRFYLPSAAKIVLSPRRIIYKMRHDLVLKAFAELVKQNNKETILLLRKYGNFSRQYQTDLQKLSNDLGIADKVIWLEEIEYEKMPALYSLVDLVVNVPEQDGLPVALFEASACKAAVITSDLAAYQEYLSKGAYYRVPVGDYHKLSEAMEYVLYSGGEEGVETIQKNYELVRLEADQTKSMKTIENIYKGII